MKIFLSHNAQDKPLAERITLSLQGDGHEVFLDKKDLPPGESYDDQIRNAIHTCDLFLFLISSRSLESGRYARTELKFAQDKWPVPGGKVLAVKIEDFDQSHLPPYLQAVTYLQPEGDVVAETAHAVDALERTRRRKARRRAVALSIPLLFGLGVLGFVGWTIFKPTLPPADVVVSPFDGEDSGFRPSRQIETEIRRQLEDAGLAENVTIAVMEEAILDSAAVRETVASRDAKLVIWGWKDNTNINIRIHQEPGDVSGSSGGEMIDLAPSHDDIALTATNMKQAAATVAMYSVAQLLYADNQFAAGHDAMDKATASLPEDGSVVIDNKALASFLRGRGAYYSDEPDKLEEAFRQYVRAALDADEDDNQLLSVIWNNIGVVSESATEEDIYTVLDELDASEASQLTEVDFFDVESLIAKALDFQGDGPLHLIQYNLISNRWNRGFALGGNSSEVYTEASLGEELKKIQQQLQDILGIDDSIFGAHALLGAILFDQADYATAREAFEKARDLQPESPEIRFDLGQACYKAGAYEDSIRELDLVSRQSPSAGSLVPLVNVLVRSGNKERALKTIEAWEIRADGDEEVSGTLSQNICWAKDDQSELIEFLKAILEWNEGSVVETEQILSKASRQQHLHVSIRSWLAEIQGDATRAAELREKAGPDPGADWSWRREALSRLNPMEVADQAIDVDQLNQTPERSAEDKVNAAFAAVQDSIAELLIHRARAMYMGAACPYLYLYNPETGRWDFSSAVLVNINSKDLERTISQPVPNFAGLLQIRELEPEVSYLDQVSIQVTESSGRKLTFHAPDPSALQFNDSSYFSLRQGESIVLQFPGFDRAADYEEVHVLVDGYYEPLPQHGITTGP